MINDFTRQRKLFPNKKYKKYIKIFVEDKKMGKLRYLNNVKSNLIINLEKLNLEERDLALQIIGKYELEIADIEIKNNNFEEAYDALFSAIHSYFRLDNHEISYNIALRSILEKNFKKTIKNKMFQLIKDRTFKPESYRSFDYFKYIVNQYIINNYSYKLQNINKVPIYIFQNLKFNEIRFPTINPYTISIHPIYSKELTRHLDILEQYNAIKRVNHSLYQGKNYYLVKGSASAFQSSILKDNSNLYKKINYLIEEFSHWDTNKIKEWEKYIGILNYFPTGETIK